jgi:hypothetical protein
MFTRYYCKLLFLNDGNIIHFTGTQVLKRLRQAADVIGPDALVFTSKQLGLHSARSGAAMAMYLAGIPVCTIMLLGRWASEAFLRYIRKQVKEFSLGVSEKMIQNENFFTIPISSSTDQHASNPSINMTSHNHNGHNFKNALLPLIRVFH